MIISNDFKQSGSTWLQWRNKGLGASDAPTVMGVSPFCTRLELWLEKSGICDRPPFHPRAVSAMERGKILEPVARAKYEAKVGKKFDVVNCEHEVYPFIRASLDGHNAELNKILEIKCPGQEDLKVARAGKVPEKYMPQLQQQFLVSGAASLDYVTYDGADGLYITEVKPDAEYIANLTNELRAFWELVQTKTPPKVTKEDLKKLIKLASTYSQQMHQVSAALTIVGESIAPKYSKNKETF